jgi:hypothetical protein
MSSYDQRMTAERKRIAQGVDDFLRDRLRPDNPIKAAARHHSAEVLAIYYERKHESAKRKV